MAALVEGSQYGLSSQGKYSEDKILLFVKVTDSALRAIEEYQKQKNSTLPKPSIQFDSNHGAIRIPTAAKTSTFGFSVSTFDKEMQQGSFECIQQTAVRSLESLGALLYKMQIQAGEDSYEKTRVKMATVEQESKKNCTKEIKVTSSSQVGRRVKVKRPPLAPHKVPPPSTTPPPPSSSHNHLPSSLSSAPLSAPIANTAPATTASSQQSNPSPRSDIMRRSYRDRVIHLLALRSYKKPELLARLMRDGIREQDRKSLTSILQQVACLKDNSYSLMRHAWQDVKEDQWPYYTSEERETVRRNRTSLSSTPPPVSPPTIDNNCVMDVGPSQRTSSLPRDRDALAGEDAPSSKRQRVSLYQQPPSQNGRSLTSAGGGNNSYGGFPTPPWGSIHTLGSTGSSYGHSSPECSPNSQDSLTHVYNNRGQSSNSCSPIANDLPEHISRYVEITSPEQRRRYKADFECDYPEYLTLYREIDRVAQRFASYERKLNSVAEDSEEWHRMAHRIKMEYEQSKTEHEGRRRKFQMLHDKLAHIKQLVVDYDSQHNFC